MTRPAANPDPNALRQHLRDIRRRVDRAIAQMEPGSVIIVECTRHERLIVKELRRTTDRTA